MNQPVLSELLGFKLTIKEISSLTEQGLGLVKLLCPNIGEGQDWEQEWVGWGAAKEGVFLSKN